MAWIIKNKPFFHEVLHDPLQYHLTKNVLKEVIKYQLEQVTQINLKDLYENNRLKEKFSFFS
jgi:hypothetical protein